MPGFLEAIRKHCDDYTKEQPTQDLMEENKYSREAAKSVFATENRDNSFLVREPEVAQWRLTLRNALGHVSY